MGVDRKTNRETTLYVWVAPNWRFGELTVLEELPHEALALEVWRAIARVKLWAEAPTNRGNLFSVRPKSPDRPTRKEEARAQAPQIAEALDALDAVLTPAATPRALVDACERVSEWAEQHGYLVTAIQAIEGAAAVAPEDPALANAAGRVCRRAGEGARAEVWYARAVGLARESQNPREYVSGHLGLAAVLRDAGQHSRALKWIRRAADTARRTGLRGKAAEAYHDALGVAVLDQHLNQAVSYASRALAAYPVHHKRFPAFAYDLSFLLVNRGLYPTALSLLSSVVTKIESPAEQMVVWGTLARAAGGAGQRERFRDAADRVLELAPRYSYLGSGALYSAAEGARLIGDWALAGDLVDRALTAAEEHDSVVVLEVARMLRADVEARRSGIPLADRRDPRSQVLRDLAAEIRLRLARWRGPTWRPRRHSVRG
jgi:tetratricopeptide (TPR) repeat protein